MTLRTALLFIIPIALCSCGSSEESGWGGAGGTTNDASTDGTAGAAGTGGVAGQGGGTAGGAGNAGTGAAAGAGGSGGSGGAGGAAGGAGTGGLAGGAGEAGAAGQAGQAGAGGGAQPQCAGDGDCELHDDCCTCMPIVKGTTPPDCSVNECLLSTCTTVGIQGVKCVAGQCVLDASCNASNVLCNAVPPDCLPDELPTVVNQCWGKCIKASYCSDVAGCSECDPALYVCVDYQGEGGQVYHCVSAPDACKTDVSCACMGAAVCVDSFNMCSEGANMQLNCDCPAC